MVYIYIYIKSNITGNPILFERGFELFATILRELLSVNDEASIRILKKKKRKKSVRYVF